MLTFFRSERPTIATLRRDSTATSIACWTRCTFDANEATSTRPSRCGMSWRKTSPTVRSDSVTPGRSALVELRLDEPERELRRPHLRHADLSEEVRQRSHVILVAVREDDGAHVAAPLAEIAEVRQDEVDAQVLVARERKARVDDHDPFVGLDHHHVLADFAEPAERDQSRGLGHSDQCSSVAEWPPRSGSGPRCSTRSARRRSS